MSTTTSKTQPALIGGLVIGVLSALPIIYAANFCCCLWIVSGGVVAAYFLQQNSVEPITQGDAAIVGLLAGLVGAFVYLVITIPVTLFVAPMERQIAIRLLQNAQGVPPSLREAMDRHVPAAASIIFGFVAQLVLGPIFATIGGLLGGVFFRKPLPPGNVSPAS